MNDHQPIIVTEHLSRRFGNLVAVKDLNLTVEPATGEVRSASALSGHALLRPSAIDAARQWRLAPNSVDSEIVAVTLDFALRCP